jgi:hypothetical protein
MSDQMRRRFQLRYDPLQVFADSKTPAGLYARQKWLQEGKMHNWIHDFRETVKALRMDQLPDGSWGHSKINTIQRLFSLHLTVREPDDAIRKGIDWLLRSDSLEHPPVTSRMKVNMICNQDEDKIEDSSFHNLPFTNGCMNYLGICAASFLANCFGLGEEKRITGLYDAIAREIEARDGHWYNIDCMNNALRAFATHSRYARSKSTAMMVNYLGQRQLPSGRWAGRVPFYLTFNALAHLNSANAKRQCATTIENVLKTQNKDGSWGRSQKEWNTFLVVHALNRLNAH